MGRRWSSVESPKSGTKVKISALFSDYDGTLAPDDVPIAESRISPETDRALRSVARQVPFALITMKDFDFISGMTSYASGWACVGGLEVVLGTGLSEVRRHGRGLGRVLDVAVQALGDQVRIEKKMGTDGELLGFSMDWRGRPRPRPAKVAGVLAEALKNKVTVNEYPSQPYIDFLAAPPDKAGAVRTLRHRLKIHGPVLFLGDSTVDNGAFKEADFAICLDHGQSLLGIEADYVLSEVDLDGFLNSLVRSGMFFSSNLPGVRIMRHRI